MNSPFPGPPPPIVAVHRILKDFLGKKECRNVRLCERDDDSSFEFGRVKGVETSEAIGNVYLVNSKMQFFCCSC